MLEFIFWVFFIFIVIGYVFKLFLRYGLPWLLKRFMKSQQQKYSDSSFSSNNFNDQRTDEGEVNISKEKRKKSEDDKDDFGEYVDFEDVE